MEPLADLGFTLDELMALYAEVGDPELPYDHPLMTAMRKVWEGIQQLEQSGV